MIYNDSHSNLPGCSLSSFHLSKLISTQLFPILPGTLLNLEKPLLCLWFLPFRMKGPTVSLTWLSVRPLSPSWVSSRFATLCVVKEGTGCGNSVRRLRLGGHGSCNKDSLTLNGMPKSWSWMLEDSGKRCNLGSQGFCLNVGLSAWIIISRLLRQEK